MGAIYRALVLRYVQIKNELRTRSPRGTSRKFFRGAETSFIQANCALMNEIDTNRNYTVAEIQVGDMKIEAVLSAKSAPHVC